MRFVPHRILRGLAGGSGLSEAAASDGGRGSPLDDTGTNLVLNFFVRSKERIGDEKCHDHTGR